MDAAVNESSTGDVGPLHGRVREEGVRGSVSAADWRALADADPALARRELAAYLDRREDDQTSPFEQRGNGLSVVIGMVVGTALMVAVWIIMPRLYAHWDATDSPLAGLGTIGMLGASLLPFGGAYLAWRWNRSRRPADDDVEALLRRVGDRPGARQP